jgi:hypothetical protein
VPLYQEEMDLKLKKGSEALFKLMVAQKVNELVDIKRKNVAKKTRWLF